jgi:putative DNA primase/helicase
MPELHISRVAQAIAGADRFARDASGELYVFRSGFYQPTGDQYIKRRVKELAIRWRSQEHWSSYLAREVSEYIRADARELWPAPPTDLVNVENGLLDVTTLELRPHSPNHLTSIQLPVRYDLEADCSVWLRFVEQTLPKDAVEIAWEIPAWAMTPESSIQKAVALTGEGGNGKSVYLAGLTAFLGRRNVCAVSLHQLETDRFAAARLVGRLANICPDIPNQRLASTAMFKALTGGDVIQGERKYRDAFEFRPHAKLIFSGNQLPASDDPTHAFHRRWLIVPFEKTFDPGCSTTLPREELDAMLAAPKALSGLLNLALDALPRLRSRGFTLGASIQAALDEFRSVSDPLVAWLDQNVRDALTGEIPKRTLIDAYKRDCSTAKRPLMTDTAFGRALRRARPDVSDCQVTTASGKKEEAYRGIAWALNAV